MMNTIFSIRKIILIVISIFLFGCDDSLNECFNGPGKTIKKRMTLYEFNNVLVKDNIQLILKNGDLRSIEITGGENIIPMIEISIENSTLHLSNESVCPVFKDPWNNIMVVLTAPALDTIIVQSHGSLKSELPFFSERLFLIYKESPADINLNINCNYFRLEYLSGVGDIQISGSAGRGSIFHNGHGTIDLTELNTVHLSLNMQSANHSHVRAATYYFWVFTGNAGNVYYTGEPEIIEWHKDGDGELIRVFD
jgi:hypothetical protein